MTVNLPPLPMLPPLPALPALPMLAPLPALAPIAQLPFPFEPEANPLRLTAWYSMRVAPARVGEYEISYESGDTHARGAVERFYWDARDWHAPSSAAMSLARAWRGIDMSTWINTAERNPVREGWHSMRWPRAESGTTQSYWDGKRWLYADEAGELHPFKMVPKWQAEWLCLED